MTSPFALALIFIFSNAWKWVNSPVQQKTSLRISPYKSLVFLSRNVRKFHSFWQRLIEDPGSLVAVVVLTHRLTKNPDFTLDTSCGILRFWKKNLIFGYQIFWWCFVSYKNVEDKNIDSKTVEKRTWYR